MSWILLAAFWACMGPEDFEEDHNKATCALVSDCELLDQHGWASTAKCEAGVQGLPEGCESIDKAQAKLCVEGIEQMDCDDLLADAYPATCETVCAE